MQVNGQVRVKDSQKKTRKSRKITHEIDRKERPLIKPQNISSVSEVTYI